MEQTNKIDNSKAIIDSVSKLLKGKPRQTMECCYKAIYYQSQNRHFDDLICKIDYAKFDSLFPLVSLVIITANKIECDVLNYILSNNNEKKIWKRELAINILKGIHSASPDAYIIQTGSVYILHLQAAETGANTPGGSTDLIRYISAQKLLRPNCIISFGICYGRDPTRQQLGDVIIPRKLYPWSVGQKISENVFKIKHDNLNLFLEDAFPEDNLYLILKQFCGAEGGKLVTSNVSLNYVNSKNKQYSYQDKISTKAFYGNMSTGEAVVSSSEAKALIAKANRNESEMGGEMEGYGLAKECIYYAGIPCFIIKAICDWGEFKNIEDLLEQNEIEFPDLLKDKLQTYAAFCAGIVLRQLLEENKKYFLRLKLFKQLEKEKDEFLISELNYNTKSKIIDAIASYFKSNTEEATSIFDMFIERDMLVPSRDRQYYRVNVESLQIKSQPPERKILNKEQR